MGRPRRSDAPRPTANGVSVDVAVQSSTLLCALEAAVDDWCECCGDAFTDSSPSSPSSVDPSICEWCYVNGYDDDCDDEE